MENHMDPVSQYRQAQVRHHDLIHEAQRERLFQKLQRERQHSRPETDAATPLDALIVAVGSRLETLGRAMQGSRRQSA